MTFSTEVAAILTQAPMHTFSEESSAVLSQAPMHAFSQEMASILAQTPMHNFSNELRGPLVLDPAHRFSLELRGPFVLDPGHWFSLELAQQFVYTSYLGPRLIRGPQLHQAVKRTEWLQGATAGLGVDTVLPFTFADKPHSKAAVRAFLGTVAGGRGRLVVLGRDYDVDLLTRTATWLATARWALAPTNVLVFDYWTQGYTT